MKINLSRIHSLIKQHIADIRSKQEQAIRPLDSDDGDFSLNIFEGTTDKDIACFLEKVQAKKIQTEKLFGEIRQLIAYNAYLRHELDEANRKSGVADKLLKLDCMQKSMASLASIRDIISSSCSEELEPVKGADYYKTSFTSTNRIYKLSVKMFSEKDYDAITAEISGLEEKVKSLKDEIAFTNQTTLLEIMTLDDFIGEKKHSVGNHGC